jgi:hypothetical protein
MNFVGYFLFYIILACFLLIVCVKILTVFFYLYLHSSTSEIENKVICKF